MYMEWTGMELWIDKHYGCISPCHSQAHTPLEQISLRTNHNCNCFSIYPFGAGIWLPKLDIHAGWFNHTFINCLRTKFECRNPQWQLNLQEHGYYITICYYTCISSCCWTTWCISPLPHRIFQAHFAPLVTSLGPGKWHPLTLAQLETLGPAKFDGWVMFCLNIYGWVKSFAHKPTNAAPTWIRPLISEGQ